MTPPEPPAPTLRALIEELWPFLWAMDRHARDGFRSVMKRLEAAALLTETDGPAPQKDQP
jgi:hypothetical protein